MKTKPRNIFIGLYILCLVLLGLRPKIAPFFDNFLPISSLGGWNMYQYQLDENVSCYLTLNSGEKINIDWRKYMYHSSFASSPHPNFRKEMGDKFCDFLMQHEKQIDSLKKASTPFELNLKIRLIKERQDTIKYDFKRK